MSKSGFRELKVWQKSRDIAVLIYNSTNSSSFNKDFGLRDQMRRSAVSISSNIAEGDERETDREAVRFFYIAKGSSAELLSQSIIAQQIGYLDQEGFSQIERQCLEVSGMLSRLISARAKTFNMSKSL